MGARRDAASAAVREDDLRHIRAVVISGIDSSEKICFQARSSCTKTC
ncbi:hypothetical protein [Anaplasma phagocytophilum]|nr:hypothetical protein [Anaplasma phagocytophilum]